MSRLDPVDKAPLSVELTRALLNIEAGVLFLVLLFLIVAAATEDRAKRRRLYRQTGSFGLAVLAAAVLAIVFSLDLGGECCHLAFVIACGMVLTRRGPVFGTAVFVALLFLRPWELLKTNELMSAMPKLFAGLVLSSVLAAQLRTKDGRLLSGAPTALLMGFAGWTLLSTVQCPDPLPSQIMYFDLFPRYLVLFFLMVSAIRDRWSVTVFCGALVLSVCGVASLALYRNLADPLVAEGSERLKAIGLFENANDVAAIGVLAFPLAAVHCLKQNLDGTLRALALVASLTMIALVWYAESRGALMGVAASLFAFLLIRYGKRLSRALRCALLFAVLVLPVIVTFKRDIADTSASTQSRINYWIAGARMALHHPLLGVGFGEYPKNYERYSPQILEWGNRTAHSSWVLALAETGFPGLALFAGFYFVVLKRAWELRETYPELFCSVVGYGVVMSFLSHTYLICIYLLSALVVGAGLGAPEPSAARARRGTI